MFARYRDTSVSLSYHPTKLCLVGECEIGRVGLPGTIHGCPSARVATVAVSAAECVRPRVGTSQKSQSFCSRLLPMQ